MTYYLRRLGPFDSVDALRLESRAPGTYDVPFQIQGNSILSTLYIESADPGATVQVYYWDRTLGKEGIEEYQLAQHKPITLGHDRLTVTRIHDKPNLRAIVSGGNVVFSVYATVVDSFASDMDSSLQSENEAVVLERDKGIPITALEETTGLWKFLRVINGRLQVDVPKILAVQSPLSVLTPIATLNVTGVAVEAKAEEERMADRRIVCVFPSNGKVWYGTTPDITPETGIPIFKNDRSSFEIGDAPLYLVSEGSVSVRVWEAK